MHWLTIDVGLSYLQSVFLAGMGRSGTTWVAEVLNYDNRYRTIFEPFHPGQVRDAAHLDPLRYRRPTTEDEALLRYARRVFTGRVGGPWIDRFNRRVLCRKRLVKEIRANLWLKWLKVRFPKLPIILVMRHPCAVAESWLRLGWTSRERYYFSQPDLVEDFLAAFQQRAGMLTTPFEGHVMAWCVQHYVPLRQFEPGEIHVIFYERLLLEPEVTVRATAQFLNQNFDERIFQALGRPSRATSKNSAVFHTGSGHDAAFAWQDRITPAERRRAAEILQWFGLDAIYSHEPLPVLKGNCPLRAMQQMPGRF